MDALVRPRTHARRHEQVHAICVAFGVLVQELQCAVDAAGFISMHAAGDEHDGSVVAHRILREKSPTWGFDAFRGEYGDMLELGIIDPAKVTKSALLNAASVATLLLTTDALIANKPEKAKTSGAPGMEGMDGMDGMGGMDF